MPEQRKSLAALLTLCLLGGFGFLAYSVVRPSDSSAGYQLRGTVVGHSDASARGGISHFKLADRVYGGDTYVGLLAQDMYKIAKHEVDSVDGPREIHFQLMADGSDEYGNRVELPAFDISYSMDDLKRVNWADVGAMRLLNLATILDITPEGRKVIEQYCAENEDISDSFCASAMQKFPPG